MHLGAYRKRGEGGGFQTPDGEWCTREESNLKPAGIRSQLPIQLSYGANRAGNQELPGQDRFRESVRPKWVDLEFSTSGDAGAGGPGARRSRAAGSMPVTVHGGRLAKAGQVHGCSVLSQLRMDGISNGHRCNAFTSAWSRCSNTRSSEEKNRAPANPTPTSMTKRSAAGMMVNVAAGDQVAIGHGGGIVRRSASKGRAAGRRSGVQRQGVSSVCLKAPLDDPAAAASWDCFREESPDLDVRRRCSTGIRIMSP